MPVRRAVAARGSFLVFGVEPPATAATVTRAAAVVSARPRGAQRTVRLRLPPPPGSSRLAEIPFQTSLYPRLSVHETPSGWGEGGGLQCPGRSWEGSLASELGGCQAPGTRVIVSWRSWCVFPGALLGARVAL